MDAVHRLGGYWPKNRYCCASTCQILKLFTTTSKIINVIQWRNFYCRRQTGGAKPKSGVLQTYSTSLEPPLDIIDSIWLTEKISNLEGVQQTLMKTVLQTFKDTLIFRPRVEKKWHGDSSGEWKLEKKRVKRQQRLKYRDTLCTSRKDQDHVNQRSSLGQQKTDCSDITWLPML